MLFKVYILCALWGVGVGAGAAASSPLSFCGVFFFAFVGVTALFGLLDGASEIEIGSRVGTPVVAWGELAGRSFERTRTKTRSVR